MCAYSHGKIWNRKCVKAYLFMTGTVTEDSKFQQRLNTMSGKEGGVSFLYFIGFFVKCWLEELHSSFMQVRL